MNSVSPSSAQYLGVAGQDEPLGDPRRPLWKQQAGPLVYTYFEQNHDSPPKAEPARDGGTGGEPEVDKLKAKLMSAWNQVKYGWSIKAKTTFNKTSPVIILGDSYLLNSEDEVECFRLAFASRLWMTYRREFPAMDGSSWTTDCGWGCMLRSGQMMLAQGLLVHLLPRDWAWPDAQQLADVDIEGLRLRSPTWHAGIPIPSWGSHSAFSRNLASASRPPRRTPPPTGEQAPKRARRHELEGDWRAEPVHRRLVGWFGDTPPTPFGVHQLVELGKSAGKKAGDWYGPSVVAHILRKAVAKATEVHNLTVYVAQDCTVYKEDVVNLCDLSLSSVGQSETIANPGWKSVIILVPVRLGVDSLNPCYIESMKKILNLDCCIGIIGGKPKHSLYFVGYQDEQLLYLDPHYCQPVVDVTQDNSSLESFHCSSPRKMPFSRMDPSCTIGFYAKNKKDFEYLCSAVSIALLTSKEYPIFTLVEGQGQDYALRRHSSAQPDPSPTHILPLPPGKLTLNHHSGSIDDFIFL